MPYFKERPTLCTVTAIHEDKGSDVEENDFDEENERSASPGVNIPQTTVAFTSKKTHAISGSSHSYITPVVKRTRIRQTTIAQPISSERPSTSLMKFILENKTKTNDIQQFFDSIATTVQSFPPRDRAIAKAKVFSVISQMELEILGRNPNISSEYVASPASYETQISETRNDFYSPPSPQTLSSDLLVDNASEISGYNTIQERGLESAHIYV